MSDPFISAALLEGIPSTYAGARDGLDGILRDRGLRRSTPDDTARALLLGAAATASLEGSTYDVDEPRRVAATCSPVARCVCRPSCWACCRSGTVPLSRPWRASMRWPRLVRSTMRISAVRSIPMVSPG
ncbi:hypothetical protein ACHMWU_23700 [Aeromicrobium sp. UC242_57]